VKLSSLDLPMFFDPAQQALGTRLMESINEADPALHVPEEVIPRLATLGFLELLVPEGAMSVRSLCLAREALAYVSGLADSIFAVQGLGSHPIVLTPAFPERDRLLAEVVAGKRVCAFALTEPEAGSDVASMRTTARRDGTDWVLDGEKVFISNVGIAHHFIVFANADPPSKKGISAFLVEADTAGLTLTRMPLSVEHPLGRLTMNNCRVGQSALLGEVGHGLRLALGTLDVFRTSVGAAAVGMARRALDETIARVKSREQFGQKLAAFQLTQAAIAEMATELDAARLLVYRAAWHKDHDPQSREGTNVAMAKMFATEAAQRIIDRAVQLHGGSGVLEGSVVERLYREIRPLRIYEGTTEIQKLIIGGALTK
jgi:acyl-CoA dehydrogenase